MRKNKFRYTVIKGSGHVMVETFPLGDIENGRVVTWLKVNHASDDTCEIHVDQFTGLTDKNGVEIFEGDIVDQITTPVAVYFAHGAFLMHAEYHQSQFVADHANRLTVIGNIHEHSDLLKGEQQ